MARTLLLEPVTEDGLKFALVPGGKLLVDSTIVPVNPEGGVMVSGYCAVPPCTIDRDAGVDVIVPTPFAVKFAVTLKGPDNVIVCGFCVAEGAPVKLVKTYPLFGVAEMVTAPLETQPVPGEMVPPAAGLAEVVS